MLTIQINCSEMESEHHELLLSETQSRVAQRRSKVNLNRPILEMRPFMGKLQLKALLGRSNPSCWQRKYLVPPLACSRRLISSYYFNY